MLGPDWSLVDRTAAGYRIAPRIASRDVQKVLFINQREPDWLYEQGRRIADALNRGEIALAQIDGLRIPIGDIDQRQLKQLAALVELRKAGFNPDEPRIPAGQHGGGEWTVSGDSGSDWADDGDSGGGEGTDNGSNGGGTIGSDSGGEEADSGVGGGIDSGDGGGDGANGGDSGGDGADGGDSGVEGAPVPALSYMGEPAPSSATPLVGGRWPAPTGANPNPLFFPAQAEEDQNSRSGGLLGDFMDLPIEFRQQVYEGLRARLEAIEPSNPALQALIGPDYSPTQGDIDSLSEALREAQGRVGEPPATEWELGWGARGVQLELQRLGGERTLPFNAPIIDDFSDDGVVVSIKSIDLNAPWYGNPANLSRLIDRYVDQLGAFNGMEWGNATVRGEQITGKVLDIVIPKNSGSAAQQQVITDSIERARQLGVYILISRY